MCYKSTGSEDVAVLEIANDGWLEVGKLVENRETNGIVPRRANAPLSPPVDDHCMNISARRRALSRFPDARKCGSAASKAPSTHTAMINTRAVTLQGWTQTFVQELSNIMM